MLDALPAATLPFYPDLKPASEKIKMCSRWLVYSANIHIAKVRKTLYGSRGNTLKIGSFYGFLNAKRFLTPD